MISEFKKSINYKYLISISIITMILLLELYSFYQGNTYMYVENNAIHSFLSAIDSPSRTLVPIILLLGAWIYSDTLYTEWKNGYLRIIAARMSLRKYIFNKFLINFIITYSIVTIPLLITFITSRLLFVNNLEVLNSTQYYNVQGLLQNFYINSPDLYMLCTALLSGLPFALFITLSISASFLINNKILIITLPFILYFVLDIFIGLLSLNITNPEYILTWIRVGVSSDLFLILAIAIIFNIILIKLSKNKGVVF